MRRRLEQESPDRGLGRDVESARREFSGEFCRFTGVRSSVFQGGECILDHLVWAGVGVWEHRAQDFVSFDHIEDGSFEGRHVERTVEGDRGRDVVCG